jgi:hypothetical protein
MAYWKRYSIEHAVAAMRKAAKFWPESYVRILFRFFGYDFGFFRLVKNDSKISEKEKQNGG